MYLAITSNGSSLLNEKESIFLFNFISISVYPADPFLSFVVATIFQMQLATITEEKTS
jgi:hypothetical protein